MACSLRRVPPTHTQQPKMGKRERLLNVGTVKASEEEVAAIIKDLIDMDEIPFALVNYPYYVAKIINEYECRRFHESSEVPKSAKRKTKERLDSFEKGVDGGSGLPGLRKENVQVKKDRKAKGKKE